MYSNKQYRYQIFVIHDKDFEISSLLYKLLPNVVKLKVIAENNWKNVIKWKGIILLFIH